MHEDPSRNELHHDAKLMLLVGCAPRIILCALRMHWSDVPSWSSYVVVIAVHMLVHMLNRVATAQQTSLSNQIGGYLVSVSPYFICGKN